MKNNIPPVYYGDYLQLDKILGAQQLQSQKYATAAHDETLFIIVHQVYELWFKQILHELNSIISVFSHERVDDRDLTTVVHRLRRITQIQQIMNDQISVMETMTPQEFLAFRDYLVPASGFQSIQFKQLEISLGLKREYRIDFDQESFYTRLTAADRQYLTDLESKASLFELVDKWLARMPLLEIDGFSFWSLYKQVTDDYLADDEKTIAENSTLTAEQRKKELEALRQTQEKFDALLNTDKYQSLLDQGQFRLSQKAMLSALFIKQYSQEPIFNLPFQLITLLTEVDEKMTIWRHRHAMMVHRMLGGKIGTGGSAGHQYLHRTTQANRVFVDFFDMATFLLPKHLLPKLPDNVTRYLEFHLYQAAKQPV
ncbi:tryptophan 2,3-dioxygenase family protein [Alteromonas oceanisediminis]|uniref:tryptophan 2,3-dioxygenase family protein n=1 Tax=Alteromonas oceanisediminis TaxID=2836180 RepID=UPI001BD9E0FF|nr:tryptophan 2,3-dioxygenase family protein [Alteromonas oceanisediminis]MBT0584864.1 tryptophan 2,3-dioxygenase [Alteromonas oceanisediminis]